MMKPFEQLKPTKLVSEDFGDVSFRERTGWDDLNNKTDYYSFQSVKNCRVVIIIISKGIGTKIGRQKRHDSTERLVLKYFTFLITFYSQQKGQSVLETLICQTHY